MLDGLKKFSTLFVLRLSWQLLLRLFNSISHARMKHSILELIENRNIDNGIFVDSISENKREALYIEDDFDLKILATAAPKCYASIIAEKEQFDICLATDFIPSGFNKEFENIKEVKKDNVMQYLGNHGINEIDVLITDHIDDLPLMKLSKRNIIVYPNKDTIKGLRKSKVAYETLD